MPLVRTDIPRHLRSLHHDRFVSIMDRIPNEYRYITGELLLQWRRAISSDSNAVVLTHIKNSEELLEYILHKWDFGQWCPFPRGVQRRRKSGNWIIA
ncbi:hypothetical protein CPB86DRAFT_257437 [Serendipita vermifera]|nr:hypothetical protein CPB86DRAFT_257437 [Serendipita vermifera]